MTAPDDITALARRFFDAIEQGDIATVRAIYAPDAVIWHNTDELDSTPAENAEVLQGFIDRIRERRYENRRVDVFPGGFVQQHLLTGLHRNGQRLRLVACIVCRVSNGRITRLDEYFDSAAVAPWRA
ncbi:limonene-1,2-epoxide hydrolase [Gammaproteobacteria bacterium]|nr:limonene-1,2-epoxide hydrolase [Gammaproteobacteria bacterium]